ncbi:MAG: thiolase domain-containing protein [Rhodospirillales bacterium]
MSPDVLVQGGSVLPFGRRKDGSGPRDWARQVVGEALADAGLGLDDIESVVVGYESDHLALQLSLGALLIDEIGAVPRPLQRVEAGGASGAAAVRAGYLQIKAGAARAVLVLGVEHAASHLAGEDVGFLYGLSFDADLEGYAGATAPALYALSMAAHAALHGTSEEDMALVSVKNFANAAANPWAHRRRPVTLEEVLASPPVSPPYKRLDCSPLSDGAAALVLTASDWAPAVARPKVRLAASACATDHVRLGDRADPQRFAAKARAAREGYRQAAIADPLRALALAELYDAFSGAELQAIEDLGLAAPGQAAARLREGYFAVDGALPINVSGGLIGQGAAPGATGVAQVVTAERLLTDRYWRAVETATSRPFALVESHGGIATVCLLHILERRP